MKSRRIYQTIMQIISKLINNRLNLPKLHLRDGSGPYLCARKSSRAPKKSCKTDARCYARRRRQRQGMIMPCAFTISINIDCPRSMQPIVTMFYNHHRFESCLIIASSEHWFCDTDLTREINPCRPESLVSGTMLLYAIPHLLQ